jgi:ribosome-binding ATPase YchF (GTP1/OBG family)
VTLQGAAEGAGLGNAFLSHISATDAIYMMLRAFENADITHVEGDVNPVRDIDIINEELLLKDIEIITKAVDKDRKVCTSSSCTSNSCSVYTSVVSVIVLAHAHTRSTQHVYMLCCTGPVSSTTIRTTQ